MAISVLAGADNFSDQEILHLEAKAQIEAVEGVWIYELAELAGLKRADTTRVKAFASRRVDQARLAYGRFPEKRPRQFILIGTTNDEKYLHDRTGNRRFWPAKTGEIAVEALRRDRDQLWAEAAFIEANGVSLTLDEGLWAAAREQQNARMERRALVGCPPQPVDLQGKHSRYGGRSRLDFGWRTLPNIYQESPLEARYRAYESPELAGPAVGEMHARFGIRRTTRLQVCW